MIRFGQMCIKVVTGTTSGTIGTRSSHAHTLPYAPSVANIVVANQMAPNNDVANAPVVAVVSADATNIVVKSSQASTAFTLYVMLQTDDGGRNLNR
jgi:hypothetical protein